MHKTLKNTTKKGKEQAMKEQDKKCPECKGTGYFKSYCDMPDRMCYACYGTGVCQHEH